jgi:hypothetical protein
MSDLPKPLDAKVAESQPAEAAFEMTLAVREGGAVTIPIGGVWLDSSKADDGDGVATKEASPAADNASPADKTVSEATKEIDAAAALVSFTVGLA